MTANQNREYLTNLFKRHSIIALCCSILTLILSFYGVIAGVNHTIEVMGRNGFISFIFFTNISSTLCALSVSFIIPFAVEGIRKKRFILPRWVAVMYYFSACSTAIVMVFVSLFISRVSPKDAFSGFNLVTHILCPMLILIIFFQVENGYIYSWKDRLIGFIPFFIYMIVYYIEVVLIGETRGGWPDIYRIREYMRPELAIPLMGLFGLVISSLVATLANYLTKIRKKKMYQHWKEGMDPVEVKIEAYGLGTMEGETGKDNSILIPLDILEYLAERYQMNTEELIRPYIKGVINGRKRY